MTANNLFYYSIPSLFARVKNRTATRVKMIIDESGTRQYDELAMTDQEEPDFNVLCKRAAGYIYKLLRGLRTLESEAYGYDVEVDGEDHYVIFTLDPGTSWDENTSQSLDTEISEALEVWICREWFRMVGRMDFVAELEIQWDEVYRRLRNTVFQPGIYGPRRYRIM